MNPQLIVEQKITAFVNRYAVYDVTAEGKKGALVAFAQQKRIALREKITFYTDDTQQTVAFTLRAEKILDVHGRYSIEDNQGQQIGALRKEFVKSLLSSTWKILNEKGDERLVVGESNQVLAVLRRFAGFIPIVGDLFEIILLFLRYHFTFITPDGDTVGEYRKTTLFRDHYVLNMADSAYGAEDWRVLAAMAVSLDVFQSR